MPKKSKDEKLAESGLVIPRPAELPKSKKPTLLDDLDFFSHCVRHYGQMIMVASKAAQKALAGVSPLGGSSEQMAHLTVAILRTMNSPLYFEWERYHGLRKQGQTGTRPRGPPF